MPSTYKQISYMYIEYSTAFHMKYKHLFVDSVYDYEEMTKCPLVITWAAYNMCVEDGNKCLAVAAKTEHYEDRFKVTEDFFESALQAFFIFPDANLDDEESNKLRLEFVKALLNK